MVKNLPAMQKTQVQSLGWEDPLEKQNGDPVQNSRMENSMDRGAWWATVRGVAESDTTEWVSLSFFHFPKNQIPNEVFLTLEYEIFKGS